MIKDFVSGKKKIAIAGPGYVGLPLCINFGKAFKNIIGFDPELETLIKNHQNFFKRM